MSLMVEDAISAVAQGYDVDQVVEALLQEFVALPDFEDAGLPGEAPAVTSKQRAELKKYRRKLTPTQKKAMLALGGLGLIGTGVVGLRRRSARKKAEREAEMERQMPRHKKAARWARRQMGYAGSGMNYMGCGSK